MQFVRIRDVMEGVPVLAKRLSTELGQGRTVLWFVSGGSNIGLTVAVMDSLGEELTKNLMIYPCDERFGPVGHPDSNFQQLVNAGFSPKQATVVPVLVPAVGFKETVERYNQQVREAFGSASVVIGQFGIGADGHICGILPGTSAVTSKSLVAGYTTETYTRITLTPKALERVSVAYAFAFGDTKRTALSNLQSKDLSLSEQPSQILKQLPESYVYSDQIEGTTRAESES